MNREGRTELMGLSLRDQLVQAGLVSEKQAKAAAKEQHHHKRAQAARPRESVDPEREKARRAEAEKRERDLAANRQLVEKVDEKARRAQIRQLVERHKLPKIDGHDYYNFIAGKKVKRIAVDAARRAQLVSGAVFIVNCDGNFEMVPAATAERIRERDARTLIPHAPAPAAAADDPYKDHVVPDDLIW